MIFFNLKDSQLINIGILAKMSDYYQNISLLTYLGMYINFTTVVPYVNTII